MLNAPSSAFCASSVLAAPLGSARRPMIRNRTRLIPSPARIAHERHRVGRPDEFGIDLYVRLGVEPDLAERDPDELADRA